MTFYMIAMQLVQFSLAVMADALPLVRTYSTSCQLAVLLRASSCLDFDSSGLHSVMTPRLRVGTGHCLDSS